jgi:NAD(P)-dependent dehydrogenase (short-subunit alcohol dehydrogenase family)
VSQVELPQTPSFNLAGRRALVTGAGRGIGLGCAAALAQAGAHVTLAARSLGEVEQARDEIVRNGGSAEAVSLDVNDLERTAQFIADAEPFDILVNNAGTNKPQAFADVSAENFDLVISLNVRAAFFTAQAVARRLIAAGRPGSIINMSSQMGHVGGASRSVYCTSKWALEGMTKAMAIDLAPHRIRANTICPTFIETAMTRPFFENAEFKAAVLSKIKIGRIGQVEDLLGSVLLLASDASAMITGTSIIIDGGWTAE